MSSPGKIFEELQRNAGIATRLAEDGNHVVAVDVSEGVVDVAAGWAAAGLSAESKIVDLADRAAIDKLVGEVVSTHDRLDILVNNAGIAPKVDGRRPVSETMPMEQWDQVLQVNLSTPFQLARLAIAPMRARGWGRIINISSRAGRTLVPTAGAHYAATKAGLIGLGRVLAGELAPVGITVNTIAPGRVETPLSEHGSAEMLAALKREIPVGRAGRPEEIAAVSSFIAGDESAFITGAVFDVNGGVSML